jgi:hypothetical protein
MPRGPGPVACAILRGGMARRVPCAASRPSRDTCLIPSFQKPRLSGAVTIVASLDAHDIEAFTTGEMSIQG